MLISIEKEIKLSRFQILYQRLKLISKSDSN